MQEAILGQDYDGYFDWMVTFDNPYPVGRTVAQNIQLAYAKMRRIALAEGYSRIWIVEADTIPPRNALSKLAELNAPIVTGVYVLRHGANVPNLWSSRDAGENLGSGVTWQELSEAMAKGQTLRVSGGCMGCVLVRPEALDFNFEDIVLNTNGHARAPDMDWMRLNWKKGLTTLARLDVLCGHKDSSGEILFPTPQGVKVLSEWES